MNADEQGDARKSIFLGGRHFFFRIIEDIVMLIRFYVLLFDGIDDVVRDASNSA